MEIRAEPRDGYVHMTVSGRAATLDASMAAVVPALEACHAAGTRALLLDVREIEGTASVAERYYLGSAIAAKVGAALRIALLCRDDQWMADRPLENTAVNRGALFLSTTSLEEALAWLRVPR